MIKDTLALSNFYHVAVINGISRCSHMRAIEYWTEALQNRSCTMWGTKTTMPDYVVTYELKMIE